MPKSQGLRRVALALAVLALAAVCVFAYAGGARQHEREFFAMDTWMWIRAYGSRADALLDGAQREIERLDALWSVTRIGSEINTANALGLVQLSADTEEIIRAAVDISAATDGTFDITVYPFVKAWGFTAEAYRVPPESELAELRRLIGSDKLAFEAGWVLLEPGMAIDLGAIAKGFASQRVAEQLVRGGVKSAIMSLGGNVQAIGSRPDGSPWHVSIRDPLNEGKYIGAVRVSDTAVITSGITERYFTQDEIVYHHIIDPATGMPADTGIVSVTVVARSGVLADALSTALLVMGPGRAEQFWRSGQYDFEMIIVMESGEIVVSQGLEHSFEPAEGRAVSVAKK